jgi:PAS domain S-box-containing protein
MRKPSPATDGWSSDFYGALGGPESLCADLIGILDTVDLPVVVVGRDFSITRFNRAAMAAVRLTPSDIGRSVRDVQCLAGMKDIEKLCMQVIADGVPCRREIRDGDRWFVLRVAPYTGSDRQIGGAVLTLTNVTAFRASIDQAIYEREYTKAILNTVIEPLVVLDADLRVQTANRAFYVTFGVSREQTHSVPLQDLGNHDWRASRLWAVLQAMASDDAAFQTMEIERDFPANGRRTVLVDARRLSREGAATILLAFQDITERKRSEEALRASEERLRMLIASSPIATVVIDLEANVRLWNAAAATLFGWTEDEVLGQRAPVVPEGKLSESIFCHASALRGEVFVIETQRKRRDGSLVEVSLTAAPLRDREGAVTQILILFDDIGERKRAEEALRESEGRFRALVTASSDVVYRMSPDWTEMRHLDGRQFIADTHQPSGAWLDDYIPPDDQPRVTAVIAEAVRTRSVFELEHRIRRVDGSLGWTFSRAIPILDANNEIVEWFGMATDVTGRKEALEALRQSQAELQSHAEELSRFNRVAVGREMRLIELKKEVNALLERQGEGARYPLDFEPAAVEPPPVLRPPAEEGDGLVPLASVLCTDELKRRPKRAPDYERETRALAALVLALADSPRTVFETLVETTLELFRVGSAGVSLLTRDGQSFYWPAIAGKWKPHVGGGMPRTASPCGVVIDRRCVELFAHPEHHYQYLVTIEYPIVEALLAPLHVGGKAVGTIWVITHDADRQFDAEDQRLLESLASFTSASYHVVESLGAVEQRRAALSLTEDAVHARELAENLNHELRREIADRERAQQELRDADRRKDEFLAMLAHELRNPLAPLRNMLEIMKRADGDGELVRQARDTMERQLGQMVRLVDDLLDVSRITRNRLELRKERVELAPVIYDVIEMCNPLALCAGHEIALTMPSEPIYLHADPVRLAQVFGNLINNSCKYTAPGGRIWLTVEEQGNDVVVKVKDTGVGIPPDKLNEIFDLFAQIDRSLERSHGGLGIGLTLAKRLVEMHDGSLTAHSEGPDRGSEFVVRLPVLREESKADPSPESAAERHMMARRILVVDDNRDSATSLAMLLQISGNDTQTAYDGLGALEQAEAYRPDVILLDIGLPEMNGYDACREIRSQPWGKEVVVIALTGWGQDEDRRKSQDAGFNAHLVKPVDYAALLKLLAGLNP